MLLKFLDDLKTNTTENQFVDILNSVTKDIKFNKIIFGKRTSTKEFIRLCSIAKKLIVSQ